MDDLLPDDNLTSEGLTSEPGSKSYSKYMYAWPSGSTTCAQLEGHPVS